MGSLKVDGSGELYWLEGRPKEGGRQVVCRLFYTRSFLCAKHFPREVRNASGDVQVFELERLL